MARIFKPKYRKMQTVKDQHGHPVYDLKNDRKVPRRIPLLDRRGNPVIASVRKWYVEYQDANGVTRRKAGFTDKKATEQLAAKLQRQVERQKVGIVDIELVHLETPLQEHLADYLDDLRRAGRSKGYVYNLDKRLNKLIKECGWYNVSAVTSQSITGWLMEQARRGLSARTQNQYLEAAGSFITWMIRQRRTELNPLKDIAKADTTVKNRVRRSLTNEQIARLLSVAGVRKPVYLTAMLTGLRRNELAQLLWQDVYLDGDRPHIKLRAETTKSHRADVIPLPPELVEIMRDLRPQLLLPNSRVFKVIPSMDVYRSDLKAAKIEYKDDMGRQADFHALRMTYGTLLAQSGVNIRTAMEMMRHTDIKLTTQVYTDPTLLNTSGAAQLLPRLEKVSGVGTVKATGTMGIEVPADNPNKTCLASGLADLLPSHGIDQSSVGTVKGKILPPDRRTEPYARASLSTTCHHKDNPSHRGSQRVEKTGPTRTRT